MDKTTLETEIGYRIRTSSRNFITAAEITAELNRSLDRLSSKIDLVPTITETTLSYTGTSTVALPSDFRDPIELYDRSNNQKYKRVSLAELREIEDDGINAYAIDGSNVEIESTTSAVTLTLTYYSTNDAKSTGGTPQKALSVATDEPLLQPRFHDYFVEDVAALLHRKERKFDDYKISQGEARSIFNEIVKENPSRIERVEVSINPFPYDYS